MEILLGLAAAVIVLVILGLAGRASQADEPPVAMTKLATRDSSRADDLDPCPGGSEEQGHG